MNPVDIAVAGCGPAGLASALLLARDGHRVTLFERFREPRPIGSGLMIQPTGLAVLRAMGLAETVLAAGARIDRLSGQAEGRTVLDVRYAALARPGLFGLGLHRAALFTALHRAVLAAGIAIETGREIAGCPVGAGGRRRLRFADGREAGPFGLVVDALGSSSPLGEAGRPLPYGALWASLPWPDGGRFDGAALEQRYHRASVMAGVLPMGALPGEDLRQAAFFWSLRADRLEAWRGAGLERWKDEVRTLWPATTPLLDVIDSPERLTFARYSHRTLGRPAEPGLIRVGDSWHCTSPQLGQGANMALLDAYALAKALRESRDVPEALGRAVASRRRHVGLYQSLSRLLTPVYQSDGRLLPFARDRLVGPISGIWPVPAIQAALVSGLVGRPLAPLGLEA